MIKNISIAVLPAEAISDRSIRRYIVDETGVKASRITGYHIQKKSIDARGKQPRVILQLQVFIDEKVQEQPAFDPELQNVSNKTPILIVGAGPAGLFAAIRAIVLGYRPIVLERGKDVRSRRRDLAAMNKEGVVNPESNYCYGEGGAGTYSDGKLYTQCTAHPAVVSSLWCRR
jgi:uncharacterized FAD-dependent dehydrogenase